MIQEYFYEIIALIVILTSVVIYFLLKKFKQEEINYFESAPTKAVKDPYDSQENTPIPAEVTEEEVTQADIEEKFPFLHEEEGLFGASEADPFLDTKDASILTQVPLQEERIEELEEELQTTPDNTAPQAQRVKIAVPQHGKITKENFKDFAGVKLLVAEDNLINQKVISGLLAGSGIHITLANDGQEALDILEENADFDMILMDAHMPRVDGFEATQSIRENPKYAQIVIVALSGDIAVDDIRKMTQVGMQEHLEKPLRMDKFYDILYAYTQDESSLNNRSIKDLIHTQQLNGEKGLAVCSGDIHFYRDILEEFASTYTHASSELIALLQNKESEKADAILLDFIGITANIGADTIRETALELKEAIKDLEEKSYITLLDDFEVHLEMLLEDIREYNA